MLRLAVLALALTAALAPYVRSQTPIPPLASLRTSGYGPRITATLRLLDGRPLPVYDLGVYYVASSREPMLRLLYATALGSAAADSAAYYAAAAEIWPAFAPYAEGLGVRLVALIAQQPPRVQTLGLAWSAQSATFGVVVEQRDDGEWQFLHHPEVTLAPADDGPPRFADLAGNVVPYSPPSPLLVDLRDAAMRVFGEETTAP